MYRYGNLKTQISACLLAVVKARYLCRDDAVARKMYHKLKNVPILTEYALTADIRTREKVIDSGLMYIYKKQY